ncbi:MAG: sensor histidine kinase [Actinomycetota bacterium]
MAISLDKGEQRPRSWARFSLLAVLLAACVVLVMVFHHVRGKDVVFSHFFYLPVALAALWWSWRGVGVAAFLAALLLVSHALGDLGVSIWEEVARGTSFMAVGCVVAYLGQGQKRLLAALEDHRQELERVVEERTTELREKNRELELYAQTVSHDLNAPLVVISGFLELLRERAGERLGEEEKEYLERMERAAERMGRLINTLLAYARAGADPTSLQVVDPGEVFREVAMERVLELENLGAHVEVDDGIPLVKADPLHLQQVFSNLMDNALKYRRPDTPPQVRLGWRPEGNMVCLYLRDNGMGIDPRKAWEVFQPFRRLYACEEPGLGLGLSIVRKAVESWGGRIWLESEPGKGSVFFFTLPTVDSET